MSNKRTSCFELRSSSFDTLLFTVKTVDLEVLHQALKSRFEVAPEFFANDIVVIDVRPLQANETIDLHALAAMLHEVRMYPVGIAAHESQRIWAQRNDLPFVEVGVSRIPQPAAHAKNPVTPTPKLEASIEDSKSTLIIDKPLRSGQQVYAKGDLIVLGVVSYGAEVIADGHIHIYAPLRGRALAGAQGNLNARIFCTCLEPELLSIAGIYRTTETPLPAQVQGKPVQVSLLNEKLVIEPLKLT
ncbi:septum site-determining protein MinC [Mycoavidus sp. B2-EB]|uniref:septum site-determining protein MinC n=1 Tax=Mycoavidus sp. B2-EB TaxID=2651972 RepID=UPI001625D850|nr:septum site-determining protein MinC [Mycoavidus sp. B2-EB]BBO59417.1 putative septum site-determining protein MinC [Mycoavidus sp. B2-EB]